MPADTIPLPALRAALSTSPPAYLVAAHAAVFDVVRRTVLSDLGECVAFEDTLVALLDMLEAAILDLPPDTPEAWAAKVWITLAEAGELVAGVDRLRADSRRCLEGVA